MASLFNSQRNPASGQSDAEWPADDLLLASAATFLIQGGEHEAANVLLACALGATWNQGDWNRWWVDFELSGPRAAYDILEDDFSDTRQSIKRALAAVVPHGIDVGTISIRGELVDIDPDWRKELLEIARGRGMLNQPASIDGTPLRVWNNLRFRSQSEVRIAQELDARGVAFLPNCMGRFGPTGQRRNREADFLVCVNGKLGILEVDGEPFHPPSRTVEDHERDRLFKSHGIAVIEHFDATRCYQYPSTVVDEFLQILATR